MTVLVVVYHSLIHNYNICLADIIMLAKSDSTMLLCVKPAPVSDSIVYGSYSGSPFGCTGTTIFS